MRQGVALYFKGSRQLAVTEETVAEVNPGQVLVKGLLSAISAGTELPVYRGEGRPEDDGGAGSYPLKYGYATVGEVVETGKGVDGDWAGRLVFVLHPHETYFLSDVSDLVAVPDDISHDDAVFLANMETAVGLLMDGGPMIGEEVAIFGQGVVGLLTTALLGRMPLCNLVTFDCHEKRRRMSLQLGAHASLNATVADVVEQAMLLLEGEGDHAGADLTYELSGAGEALDQAIALTGYHGRVVIGSWYGKQASTLKLGGSFHRSKIRLTSSQVSRLRPELTGRWTKERRFKVTWDMVRKVKPGLLITHRFVLRDAAQAYRLLDENPGEAIQVVLTNP